MNDELVTRRVKPQAVVMMPLSVKRWIEEQARERGTSQSQVMLDAILAEKERVEAEGEREAVLG
jgi:hypothetical protein